MGNVRINKPASVKMSAVQCLGVSLIHIPDWHRRNRVDLNPNRRRLFVGQQKKRKPKIYRMNSKLCYDIIISTVEIWVIFFDIIYRKIQMIHLSFYYFIAADRMALMAYKIQLHYAYQLKSERMITIINNDFQPFLTGRRLKSYRSDHIRMVMACSLL